MGTFTIQFIIVMVSKRYLVELLPGKCGFNLGYMYCPFFAFCDNLIIVANDTSQAKSILDCVIMGLKQAGWRLPTDRIEWQCNQFTANTGEMGGYVEQPIDYFFKILGANINVTGNCWQDVETKTQSIQGALAVRRKLWLVKSSTRKQRYYLMHRVAESQVVWACGGWEVTQRQLAKLRPTVFVTAKQFLRFPKIWTDTDQVYAQRVGRAIQEIKADLKLPDFDITILNRMYSYTGHLLRVINRDTTSIFGPRISLLEPSTAGRSIYCPRWSTGPFRMFFAV